MTEPDPSAAEEVAPEAVTPQAFPAAREDHQLDVATYSPRAGVVVVRLGGEADLAVRDRLEAALREALADNPELLVIDMSDLTFLDSTGLNVLEKTCSRARGAGCRVVLANPRHIKHALSMAGMSVHFEIEPDVDIALEVHG